MLKHGNAYAREREMALADGLRDVAKELRLFDPADYVAFIRTEQIGNLRNLVHSSTEMFFKPGTISFGQSAEAILAWGSVPRVVLDMEFHHRDIRAYFRLLLEESSAGVEIDFLQFSDAGRDPDANTQRLVDAISDARIKPVAPTATTSSAQV